MISIQSIALFIIAAALEVTGLAFIWEHVRKEKGFIWVIAGLILLCIYGFVNTKQTFDFGKTYAVYGCIFIIVSLVIASIQTAALPPWQACAGVLVVMLGAYLIYTAR